MHINTMPQLSVLLAKRHFLWLLMFYEFCCISCHFGDGVSSRLAVSSWRRLLIFLSLLALARGGLWKVFQFGVFG